MSQQIEKYKQSKILQRLLEALAPDFNKLRDKVNAVFEQGRREGLDDMEIGELVRQQMKEHYSQSTIQRVLPKSARHSEKVREPSNFAVTLTANEREPIIADKVSITPAEEEHNFNTEGMGVAIVDNDTEEPVNVAGRAANVLILPEDNNTKNIADIDTLQKENAELKQENKFLKEALQHFRNENSSLRKQLAKYQQMPNNDALYNRIALLKKELDESNLKVVEAAAYIEHLRQKDIINADDNTTKDAPAQGKN